MKGFAEPIIMEECEKGILRDVIFGRSDYQQKCGRGKH